MNKIFIWWGITMLLVSALGATPRTIQAQEQTITWQATLFCNESSGQRDSAVFGEAPDARDGPPADPYDVAKPPTPMAPYVRISLRDNLPSPYNYLWSDFRQYPDSGKTWNISVQWVPEDGESPSDVVIHWSPTNVTQSEYTSVMLCTTTGTPLKNMFVESSYTFTCPAYVVQIFKIICINNNNPPGPPSMPTGNTTGFHATLYSYTTVANDPDGDLLYYRFSWGDNVTSTWLGPYPSGQPITSSHTWLNPGLYKLKAKVKDRYGAESGWSDTLSVSMGNRAPTMPMNPVPANGSGNVVLHPTLRWVCSDPDKDVLIYDVYFGINRSPPLVISGQSNTAFLPGNLRNKTTYYWGIVARDLYGLETPGPVWSFTTSSTGNETNNTGENIFPVADASVSEQVGYPGVALILNGSRSYDTDGYLTSWSWEFGDGTRGTGEIITHSYPTVGKYHVILTVMDNDNATANDTITVQITSHNNPPTAPVVQGIEHGIKNTLYAFTVSATDFENDFLQYSIAWGDGTHNTSDFLPNGTPCLFSHSWKAAGRYTVIAIASDSIQDSPESSQWVFIEVYFIGKAGFLYDANNDDLNDSFFSNISNTTTRVQKLNDGQYRLDTNGDGRWDSLYNPSSGALAAIQPTETEEGYPSVLFWVVGVIIVTIIVVVYWYKKR